MNEVKELIEIIKSAGPFAVIAALVIFMWWQQGKQAERDDRKEQTYVDTIKVLIAPIIEQTSAVKDNTLSIRNVEHVTEQQVEAINGVKSELTAHSQQAVKIGQDVATLMISIETLPEQVRQKLATEFMDIKTTLSAFSLAIDSVGHKVGNMIQALTAPTREASESAAARPELPDPVEPEKIEADKPAEAIK